MQLCCRSRGQPRRAEAATATPDAPKTREHLDAPLVKILLQKLSGQAPRELEIDPRSTLAELKRAIHELDPPPPGFSWSLVHKESVLQDDADNNSIAECG